LEGIPENEREELKHKMDEDFGLLELATNAGKCVEEKTWILYIVHSICNTDEQLGIDRTRLMTRMTTQQLRLVPTEWRQKHKLQVHQEMEEVVEEWHTVALYIKGKNAIIYDPSFNWTLHQKK
jgi:hypothetical protein